MKCKRRLFASGELQEEAVVSKMETTAADGKRYNTNYIPIYNEGVITMMLEVMQINTHGHDYVII